MRALSWCVTACFGLIGSVVACSVPVEPPNTVPSAPQTGGGGTPAPGATSNPPTNTPPSGPTGPATDDGGAPGITGPGPTGGGDAGSGSAQCSPSATTPVFTPSYKPPVANGANTCTAAQITQMATVCFSQTSTVTACDAFFKDTANATCGSCLLPADTAPNFGALIENVGANEYGCVALIEGNATNQSCGATIEAADECAARACSTCTDSATLNQCENATVAGVCKTFIDPSNACSSKLPQTAQACLFSQTDTEETYVTRIATRFCGPK